jgi:hypothetical protein
VFPLCSNAVVLHPVNPHVLTAKAQLLDIAWRENYRAIANIAVRESCR